MKLACSATSCVTRAGYLFPLCLTFLPCLLRIMTVLPHKVVANTRLLLSPAAAFSGGTEKPNSCIYSGGVLAQKVGGEQ